MAGPEWIVQAAMPTTDAITHASPTASAIAARLRRGSGIGLGWSLRIEAMSGPTLVLPLDRESPAQRRDPRQRLLAAQQRQALEQAGGDRATGHRHLHPAEQHPRLESGLVEGRP